MVLFSGKLQHMQTSKFALGLGNVWVINTCLILVQKKTLFSSSFFWADSRPVYSLMLSPQWGAADAEIKVPSGENTGLKRSPFKAWSKSVYSHTCYAYCQGFLSCLFLHFRSIHLHFSKPLPIFPCVGCGLHMVPV